MRAGAASIGINLGLPQIDRFRLYYEEIVEWNTRVNLTSVTRYEEVQTRHFLDSLTVSLAVPKDLVESGRLLDVGSGAGFPGVPMRIAFPRLSVTLIESTSKKTAFLVHLTKGLGLHDVDVRTGRAERLAHDPELRESFDLVLVRAVGGMAVLAELTLPFCRTGGIVVAQKSLHIEDELDRARRAFETLGERLKEVKEVDIRELGEPRRLVVLEKVSPTPSRFPRRPGIPAKRPL